MIRFRFHHRATRLTLRSMYTASHQSDSPVSLSALFSLEFFSSSSISFYSSSFYFLLFYFPIFFSPILFRLFFFRPFHPPLDGHILFRCRPTYPLAAEFYLTRLGTPSDPSQLIKGKRLRVRLSDKYETGVVLTCTYTLDVHTRTLSIGFSKRILALALTLTE